VSGRNDIGAMTPPLAPAAAQPGTPLVPVSLGWVEISLPLWHQRWWLLVTLALALAASGAVAVMQPVRFTGRASFLVQPVLRPSQTGVANTIPAIAGLVGSGTSAIDQQVAILRSQLVADRIVTRFDLVQQWKLPAATARARLLNRVDVVVGRREGVVQLIVEDEQPQRAAGIANELIEELRGVLRGFALDEARQRRAFYEAQLATARDALEAARRQLQGSGFDRAALRTEPRAAAEGYARVQAEIAAAEVRLATLRRGRAEGSSEVQRALSELQALRAQLAQQEAPRGAEGGAFIARMRDFRHAEALLDGLARQAEAARVDEASEPLPLQVLDRAAVPGWPSSPRPLLWMVTGTTAALLLHAAFIVGRHRAALARSNPLYGLRLEQLRAALPQRRTRRQPT
jgi:capsular polysaccharide biosynthesis protein